LTDLARAFPETTIVLDHLGGVLGIGAYANQRAAVFEQWRKDLAALAECPNVVVKLGGMAMPLSGFGWEKRKRPATSDEFVEAQQPYYLYTIEQFGPERCMFESNFPVDKVSFSHHILYNAFKRMSQGHSASERADMFHDTAVRVYRIEV